MALIDPLATIGVLLLAMALFRVPFDGPYLILALVVFSLTFPGRSAGASTVGALAGEVVIGWVTTVALLLVIGWATGTMEIFDPRVLSAWLIATPVARFATHLAVSKLLLRRLAAEGQQRVAGLAGAWRPG